MEQLSVAHRGSTLSCGQAGEGPPVLLVHGTGVGGAAWQPQVEALAGKYRCAWFDNRGFGKSTLGDEPITLELLAQDALAVMDALGWEAAHLVGHSLGGLVLLFVAARAPQRVRSLSLLNTFATGAIPTRLTAPILWTGLRTKIGTRPMRRRAFLEMILSRSELARADDALVSRLTELFEHDLADSPPVVMRQLSAMRKASARDLLPSISAPTLVVGSDEDLIATPEASRELAASIRGSRLVLLEGSAHAAPILRADDVNAALLQHLDALPSPAPR